MSLCVLVWAAASGSAFPAAGPIQMQGRGCLDSACHGKLREQKFVHAPVSQGDCQVCHVQSGKGPDDSTTAALHQFQTRQPNLALCGQCHQTMSVEHKTVHPPFRELCTACHNPHGGKARFFITGASIGDLCLKCHGKLLENKSFIHAPMALKACPSCHVPHTSDYAKLLARPPEKVCVFCHSDFAKNAERAVSVHQPMRQACFLCHDPHGGMARGFLPSSQAELCRRCHAEQLKRGEQAQYSHHAMIENKQCSDCHDPHWAASSKLLKRPSMQICLQCHENSVQTSDGRELAAVGRQVSGAKYPHGPIRQQDCTPCHAAHGNDDPRLMKLAFPMGFYAPYPKGAYALCFSCHNSEMVEKERTLATGFRNGDRNLHYVHVHGEKGRSCRACHQEHASQVPFHIRDSVPFGKWKLMIQFKATPAGGMCLAGCHVPQAYDREHPVDPSAVIKKEP